MTNKPTFVELSRRIRKDIRYYEGSLPERVAIAWSGYLSALLEWGLISVSDDEELHALLPKIEKNPVYDIMVGRPDDE